MANNRHLKILHFGVEYWNHWLRTALGEANLNGANLSEFFLDNVDFREVNLKFANLNDASLKSAVCSNAHFEDAQLSRANLENADFSNSYLEGVDSDNIEVAQFIYLLLNNRKIRSVIDTITSKVVLILGRFTAERKGVLDSIREELRRHDYLPILFDFEKPSSRDITETVSTLAHMARFIIADLSEAKSVPQELQRVVPGLPSVPVQPILAKGHDEYGMFEHFKNYPWVLETYTYTTGASLVLALKDKIIKPAEEKAKELQR